MFGWSPERPFRNVLCHVNSAFGGRQALDWAATIAARDRAAIKIVDVVPESNWARLARAKRLRFVDAPVRSRFSELELQAQLARDRGISVEWQVMRGVPHEEIIREVVRSDHDLVVSSVDAGSTTSLHLLRLCPSPVLLTQTGQGSSQRRVLVAIDAIDSGEEEDRDRLRALEMACSMAELHLGELRIVYCLEHWSSDYALNFGEEALQRHRGRLWRLLAKCDLSHVVFEVVFESDSAADVIGAHCADVGLLVLGTTWRRALGGVTASDIPEDALSRIDCSLLALKPEGFVPIAAWSSAGRQTIDGHSWLRRRA